MCPPQEDDWNKAVNETKGFGGKGVSHVVAAHACNVQRHAPFVMPPASALLYSAAGGCGLHSVVVWAMVSQSMGGVLGFRLPMPQQGHAACALVTAAAR